MRSNDSDDDIYNSLPIESFTNEFDGSDTGSLESKAENFNEFGMSEDEITTTKEVLLTEFERNDLTDGNLKNIFEASEEFKTIKGNQGIPAHSDIHSPVLEQQSNSSMWIRCVRCGKKNEFDCNFCGKCGLQIHKVISIVEPDSEEKAAPEVIRNIKYHYKRPVFCFGPRGNCFSSFSSPSKSVRNVAKFKLLNLKEFQNDILKLEADKVIASESPHIWTEKELQNENWSQKNCILKDFTILISREVGFSLNDSLKNSLREYFASISPKDLGSIKLLATQDTVSYSRGEIDEIFHLLVIGKTMEACEMCIKFNYWDHALIIAKTLEVSFYETVMNRFLDSRFASGHPLRILYLIMTNNETYALEEIRNMINNKNMPLFVQDIWAILVNFLLRAKHESLVISKTFEDIAICLFDKNIFESALVCLIVSVISGPKNIDSIVLDKVDYLLAWFLKNRNFDTLNFSSVHILNIFINKIISLKNEPILWRCQFIKLMYAQFMSDLGLMNSSKFVILPDAAKLAKCFVNCGYIRMFKEECSIIEARNLLKLTLTEIKNNSKKSGSSQTTPFSGSVYSPLVEQTTSSPTDLPEQVFNVFSENSKHQSSVYSPIEDTKEQVSMYSPIADESSVFKSAPLSSFKEKDMAVDNANIDSVSFSSANSSKATDKSDSNANVFGKLKSWFPAGKSTSNAQENQKQLTKANLGKPSSFRYDEKLKKWVDDNDPTTFEEAPKLPPPPTMASLSSSPVSNTVVSPSNGPVNFRAKKGKVKYFDPLNPDGPSSSQLQPSVPNFD